MGKKTFEQNTADDLAMLQINQLAKLRNGDITFEQLKWFNNLTFDQRETMMVDESKNGLWYLKLISVAKALTLDALNGKETLLTAKEVFPQGISSDIFDWAINKPGIATKEQEVSVYALIKSGTCAQIFGSFGIDLDKLCLTQSQIINFCKKYRYWLGPDISPTLFLFKIDKEFFFASVHLYPNILRVHVNRLAHDFVYEAERPLRLVVPRLTRLSPLLLL